MKKFAGKKLRERFEKEKPAALKADVRLITGCDDHQTSADGTYLYCVLSFTFTAFLGFLHGF